MRFLSTLLATAVLLGATSLSRADDATSAGTHAVLAAIAASESDVDMTSTSGLKIYDKAAWSGNARLAASIQSGNVDATLVDASIDVVRTWTVDKLTAGARYRWGESDKKKTTAYSSLRAKFTHHYSETLFSYAVAKFERDDVAELTLRGKLGIGFGLTVWRDADDEFLDVYAGISGLHEDYEHNDADLNAAGEVGLDFSTKIGEATLTESASALAPLNDFDRFLLESVTTLTFSLGGNWNLDNSLTLLYAGDPPSGIEKLDVIFTVGLSYTF